MRTSTDFMGQGANRHTSTAGDARWGLTTATPIGCNCRTGSFRGGEGYVDIILAPDVFVNASVAPGTPPDMVVQRVLGKHRGQSKVSPWVLERTKAMLSSVPDFKAEAVEAQLGLIRSMVKELDGVAQDVPPDAWADALLATARAAGVERVVTDHPDLLDRGDVEGIEFLSCESWLLEVTTPPPTPGS